MDWAIPLAQIGRDLAGQGVPCQHRIHQHWDTCWSPKLFTKSRPRGGRGGMAADTGGLSGEVRSACQDALIHLSASVMAGLGVL